MAGLRLALDGGDDALRKLGAASAHMDKAFPLFDAIGAALVTSTDQRFDDESDPEGNPWPKSIRALESGGKTLTDTARLVRSLTHEATDTGVAVGTNVIYAAIHQLGGTISAKTSAGLRFKIGSRWIVKQSVTLPARPFLGLSAEDEDEIEAIAGEFVLEPVGGPDG